MLTTKIIKYNSEMSNWFLKVAQLVKGQGMPNNTGSIAQKKNQSFTASRPQTSHSTHNSHNLHNQSSHQISYSQKDHLTQLIITCSYDEESKYIVDKAVRQTIAMFPKYAVEKLEYVQNGTQKRFVEFVGVVEVMVGNVPWRVNLCILLPEFFPKRAPKVRVLNPNPSVYFADQFYAGLLSDSDQVSYILDTKIYDIQHWDSSKSVMKVILASEQLLRSRFPFTKQNNYWQNPSIGGLIPNSATVQKKPPIPFKDTAWSDMNATQKQIPTKPLAQKQIPSKVERQIPKKQVPKKEAPKKEVVKKFDWHEYLGKSSHLVCEAKKALDLLGKNHALLLEKNQKLDIFKKAIDSDQCSLTSHNKNMRIFLEEQKSDDIFKKILEAKDTRSEQILELVSSIKAREECLIVLEREFNKSPFQLEEFFKYFKKIQENRFLQKQLLDKCLV